MRERQLHTPSPTFVSTIKGMYNIGKQTHFCKQKLKISESDCQFCTPHKASKFVQHHYCMNIHMTNCRLALTVKHTCCKAGKTSLQ